MTYYPGPERKKLIDTPVKLVGQIHSSLRLQIPQDRTTSVYSLALAALLAAWYED